MPHTKASYSTERIQAFLEAHYGTEVVVSNPSREAPGPQLTLSNARRVIVSFGLPQVETPLTTIE